MEIISGFECQEKKLFGLAGRDTIRRLTSGENCTDLWAFSAFVLVALWVTSIVALGLLPCAVRDIMLFDLIICCLAVCWLGVERCCVWVCWNVDFRHVSQNRVDLVG